MSLWRFFRQQCIEIEIEDTIISLILITRPRSTRLCYCINIAIRNYIALNLRLTVIPSLFIVGLGNFVECYFHLDLHVNKFNKIMTDSLRFLCDWVIRGEADKLCTHACKTPTKRAREAHLAAFISTVDPFRAYAVWDLCCHPVHFE